jgi:hypothetical protein
VSVAGIIKYVNCTLSLSLSLWQEFSAIYKTGNALVTLRRVHETTVAVKENKTHYNFCARAFVCVCVWLHRQGCELSRVLPYLPSIQRVWAIWSQTIFGKKLLNIKWVFWFCLQFCLKHSHSKKISTRYCHKYENVFMWSTRYSCRILLKLEFSRQIFEKKL